VGGRALSGSLGTRPQLQVCKRQVGLPTEATALAKGREVLEGGKIGPSIAPEMSRGRKKAAQRM
jgi:hypothetical protein